MKKFLFIILVLFFSSNLFADYLMKYKNHYYCINSYSIQDSSKYVDVVLSDNGQVSSLVVDPIKNIHQGYDYNASSGYCNQKKILVSTGLNYNDYNFLIALSASFLGFMTIFFMSYIVVEVAKK